VPRAPRPDDLPPWVRNLAAAAIHRGWGWITALGGISPDDERGRRFRALGKGSYLSFPPGAIFGERWISIGAETLIGPHVVLSVGLFGEPIDPERPPVLVIGDRCNIGRDSHIVSRCGVTIGDDVTTGPNVYITDQNHSYAKVDVPIGQQWLHEDPVSIGDGSWLGAGVVVLPGARIGRHVAVAAGSVVRGELPDFCVAAGSPARVVRRYVDGTGWDPPLRVAEVNGPEGWPGNR